MLRGIEKRKRVVHFPWIFTAFLRYVIKKHRRGGDQEFVAKYRKTERNAPGGRVFDDLGFQSLSEQDGVTTLVFRADVPDDEGIVEIEDRTGE